MRAEGRNALLIAIAGAAAAAILASPSLPMPLRAIAAGAFAFLLPGLGITAAVLPRVRWHRSERVLLALGGSMTLTIGTALLLHLSPNGLSAPSWAGLLGAITVGGGLVGWLRSLRAPAADAGVEAIGPIGSTGGGGPTGGVPVLTARMTIVSPWAIAMLAAAGLLVVLSLVIARSGLALGPTSSFTELWLLRTDGDSAVRVGIANHEGETQDYRLILTVDGRRLGDPLEVSVKNGTAADQVIELPPGSGRPRTVEARLWRADEAPSDPPLRMVRAVVAGAEDGG